jgi:hypothetical protein
VTIEYLGLDRGDTDVAAAEHWVRELVAGIDGVVACTHLVRAPTPHVAVSVAGPRGELAVAAATGGVVAATGGALAVAVATGGALVARDEHAGRTGGRAVVFPGVERLVGRVTVGDVLARSAIERIHILGGGPAPDPDMELDTRDFVRPQWMDGRLTLVAMPAPGGRIAPFELPNPIPCCADH